MFPARRTDTHQSSAAVGRVRAANPQETECLQSLSQTRTKLSVFNRCQSLDMLREPLAIIAFCSILLRGSLR
jgi:hypothetical protein